MKATIYMFIIEKPSGAETLSLKELLLCHFYSKNCFMCKLSVCIQIDHFKH